MIDIIRLLAIIGMGLVFIILKKSDRGRTVFLLSFLATLSITNDLFGFSNINFIFTTWAIMLFCTVDFLVDN
jgi:hypothetical protein